MGFRRVGRASMAIGRGPGAAYECQDCGERTVHRDRCPTCGSGDLERLEPGDT